jgi:hypothetical protein
MTSNRLAQSSENDLGGKKGNRITGFMDETDMPTHFFFYSSLHKTLLRLTKNSFVHFT